MNDYEFASAYVESIVRGLRRTGHQDEILSKVSPAAQTLWKDPFGETWQPAKLLEEIGEAAVAIMGEQAFDNLTYGAMKERFGPIVLPMIKSSLAKHNPGAVLRKLNDLVKVAIRGTELFFQPEGTTGGILQVSYPRPVAAHVIKSWQGVLRFVFEVTAPGEIVQTFHSPHGATLQYKVAWKEPAPAS
ncbi:MAG: hypothetical protein GQE15_30150 [Archangiaceae bacterium]|nr:hypothetical protein [Archangiaceae bacterium]